MKHAHISPNCTEANGSEQRSHPLPETGKVIIVQQASFVLQKGIFHTVERCQDKAPEALDISRRFKRFAVHSPHINLGVCWIRKAEL